jgi:hypothetical protein
MQYTVGVCVRVALMSAVRAGGICAAITPYVKRFADVRVHAAE